ncbi:hypothetical protein [Streptomonospora nanhaiensis]|nr:hypothetical protein [Streptomonospora nanhaiensis]MBV2367119.1 hypothetical protein [Streptomonospora nanhaiensis]
MLRAAITHVTRLTIRTVTCRRCGLTYDAADPADVAYHTQPGGCR